MIKITTGTNRNQYITVSIRSVVISLGLPQCCYMIANRRLFKIIGNTKQLSLKLCLFLEFKLWPYTNVTRSINFNPNIIIKTSIPYAMQPYIKRKKGKLCDKSLSDVSGRKLNATSKLIGFTFFNSIYN